MYPHKRASDFLQLPNILSNKNKPIKLQSLTSTLFRNLLH